MSLVRFSLGGSWAYDIHWDSDSDGHRQGDLSGRREWLLARLRQRFGEAPAAIIDMLRNSQSRHQMVRWTARAGEAAALAEVFAEPADGSGGDQD